MPARAGLQAISLGVIQDAVVTLIPALQAAADLRLRGPRLQAEIGMRENVSHRIVLGWEIVGFRLALLAHQFGLVVILVDVMGKGFQVVKELAVDGPAVKFLPHLLAYQARTFRRDGIL